MKKYYAIKIGKDVEDKIVRSWKECKKYVYDFNSIFKSFKTKEEAREYLNSWTEEKILKRLEKQEYYSNLRKLERNKNMDNEKDFKLSTNVEAKPILDEDIESQIKLQDEDLKQKKQEYMLSIEEEKTNIMSRNVALDLIEENPNALEWLEDYWGDKQAIEIAVSTSSRANGNLLCFASNALKDDEDLVLMAMENQPKAYRYASDRVKTLPKVYFKLLNLNPSLYGMLPTKVKEEKEVITYFITQKMNKLINNPPRFNKNLIFDEKEKIKRRLPIFLSKEDKEKIYSLLDILTFDAIKKQEEEIRNSRRIS